MLRYLEIVTDLRPVNQIYWGSSACFPQFGFLVARGRWRVYFVFSVTRVWQTLLAFTSIWPRRVLLGARQSEIRHFLPWIMVWLVPQPDVDGWAWWSHDWVLVDPSTEARASTLAYITLSLLSGLMTQVHAHLHIVCVSALHILVGDGVFPPAAAA